MKATKPCMPDDPNPCSSWNSGHFDFLVASRFAALPVQFSFLLSSSESAFHTTQLNLALEGHRHDLTISVR
jgi:hypothetical protein